MQISVFPAALRVISKETAVKFYNCIKHVTLIPLDADYSIRVEPGCHISLVSCEDVRTGAAVFVPSMYDPDGTLAYRYRKHINFWLSK